MRIEKEFLALWFLVIAMTGIILFVIFDTSAIKIKHYYNNNTHYIIIKSGDQMEIRNYTMDSLEQVFQTDSLSQN